MMSHFVLCLQKKEAFVHCVHLHPSYINSDVTLFLAFIKTYYLFSSHQLHCFDFFGSHLKYQR